MPDRWSWHAPKKWGTRYREDWIPDAGSFLDWARMSGLLNISEKNQAAHIALASPDSVERVLAALKELRFALWHLIDSLQHGKPAKPGYSLY